MHGREQRVQRRDVDSRLLSSLRHAQAPADIDHAHIHKLAREQRERPRLVLPVGDVEDAAADMSLQSHDARVGLLGKLRELLQLAHGNPEFRMGASRAHVMVVASSVPCVDARENLAVRKQVGPRSQGVGVVDCDSHASIQSPGIFIARREVRREENPLRIDVRENCEHALHFAARYAFDIHTFRPYCTQDLGVRVCLHRIVDPRYGLDRA